MYIDSDTVTTVASTYKIRIREGIEITLKGEVKIGEKIVETKYTGKELPAA